MTAVSFRRGGQVGIEEGFDGGERGVGSRSSQRVQRWPRRARGGTGARESSKVRRRPKVGGELEGDAAGLPEGRGSVGRKRGSRRSL